MPTIGSKDAVKIAMDFVRSYFPDAENMELEEIEGAEDSQHWLITIGYNVQYSVNTDPIDYGSKILNPAKVRKYKAILISKDLGEIKSMKIRLI